MKKNKSWQNIKQKMHEKGIEKIIKHPELIKIPSNSKITTNFYFIGKNKIGSPATLEIDIIAYNEDETNFIEYKSSTKLTNIKKAKIQLERIKNNLNNLPKNLVRKKIHYIFIGGEILSGDYLNFGLKNGKWYRR